MPLKKDELLLLLFPKLSFPGEFLGYSIKYLAVFFKQMNAHICEFMFENLCHCAIGRYPVSVVTHHPLIT